MRRTPHRVRPGVAREGPSGPCRVAARRPPLGGPTLGAQLRRAHGGHTARRTTARWRGSASRLPSGRRRGLVWHGRVSAPTRSDPDAPSFGRGEELSRGGGLPQRARHEVTRATAGRDGQHGAQRVEPSTSSEEAGSAGSRSQASARGADGTRELREREAQESIGRPSRANGRRRNGLDDGARPRGRTSRQAGERRGGNGPR